LTETPKVRGTFKELINVKSGKHIVNVQGILDYGRRSMKGRSGTAFALAIVASCYAPEAVAQGTPAEMLPGGEWALGRWEGNVVSVGTSAGTAGLSRSPRTLIVQKDAAGTVTCLWFISDDPKSRRWTKNCKIGKDGLSLETAAKSVIELGRSGGDGLKGRFVPAGPVVAGTGSGQQVHLNRAQ
jgi:hypothetical protein